MKMLDRIYKEYCLMDPIDRKMQYWSMFNIIFFLVFPVFIFVAISFLIYIASDIEYIPDGMYPVMWLIKGKPLGADYNSWWYQSEIARELFFDKQITAEEFLSRMYEITDPLYVFELYFICLLPFIILLVCCLVIYKFFECIVPPFLEMRWKIKTYDDSQKFEYDRYRLTLAIDYCCQGLDLNQIKVSFVKGSDLRSDYLVKRKSELEATAVDEDIRRKEIYKIVYERLEYLVGKPQRKEKTYDNAVLFSTLAISSFSVSLSTLTFIISMNEDGWSVGMVAVVLFLCFVFARFIWNRLRKNVKDDQKYQVKSEKNFSDKIDYLMGLLEDVVFFNVPIIECDIDGRVAYWKKRHEDLNNKQGSPVWENTAASEYKELKSYIKRGTIALLDVISGNKKSSDKQEKQNNTGDTNKMNKG